jgi:hypothetical protein
LRRAIAWGSVGFVVGATFWHAVGFWTFVSDVVLYGTPSASGTFVRAEAPAMKIASSLETALQTVILVDPANCTALALDRQLNRTVVRPCPKSGLALRLERGTARADLANLTQPNVQAAGYRPD